MKSKHWERWLMLTARTWDDLAPVIKETGISPVDHDHRQLAEYILELNDLLLQQEKDFTLDLVEQQKLLLDKFMNYTRGHFFREEAFIKKYGLPGLTRQEEEHERILKMLDSIIFEFNTGRISSAFKLRLQLLNWIVKHINSTDCEVFDFMNICEALLNIDSWSDIRGFIRSIHIPPIDHDHKLLTEAIMNVGQAIRLRRNGREQDIEDLTAKLDEVLRQTKRHFQREEALMKKYSVPGGDIQNDQHRQFVNYLIRQRELLGESDIHKLEELEKELLFWWIQHINIYDYQTFCKNSWIGNVFSASTCTGDVLWLVSKTGNKLIDSDHEKFIEMLFDLSYIINPETDQELYNDECLKEMNELIAYAESHFSREEEIMKKNYPEIFERHKKEHDRIIRLLTEHLEGLEKRLIDLSEQLREKLLSWWIDHTNGMDYETFGATYDD